MHLPHSSAGPPETRGVAAHRPKLEGRSRKPVGSQETSPSPLPRAAGLCLCHFPTLFFMRSAFSALCTGQEMPRSQRVTFPPNGSCSQSLMEDADWPRWFRCVPPVQSAAAGGLFTVNTRSSVVSPCLHSPFPFQERLACVSRWCR